MNAPNQSRRGFFSFALAAPSVAAVGIGGPQSDRPHPVSPSEYLQKMTANGWYPITRIARDGTARGVFEYLIDKDNLTYDDEQRAFEFLRAMNNRVALSGGDFYDRCAAYLQESGHGVSYAEFD